MKLRRVRHGRKFTCGSLKYVLTRVHTKSCAFTENAALLLHIGGSLNLRLTVSFYYIRNNIFVLFFVTTVNISADQGRLTKYS